MNFDIISKSALFYNCDETDLKKMAKHLNFRTVKYDKDNIIFNEGDIVTDIGLVLSGSIRVEHNDYFGNKIIMNIAKVGDVFAEAYACIPNEPLLIDVVANENCEILFVSVPKLFEPCNVCNSQSQVIKNLIKISAQKNLQLARRNLHTSSKTIRGRLLSYFSQQISAQSSNKIVIPFDRQQFADYLNVERSALSKELGKMKKDGLIEYHKNCFEIKTNL
jgi:CRP-like cAMP-binding protein